MPYRAFPLVKGHSNMGRLRSFTTAGLNARTKLAYWNDRASESLLPLVCDIADVNTFHGSIVRAGIGDQYLAEVYADAQFVKHTRSHVSRMRDEIVHLHMPLEGECLERQHGREVRLQAGQFVLLDGTRPFETVIKGPSRVLVLGIPTRRVRFHLPCAEECFAIRPPVRASASLFSQFLGDYWAEYQRGLSEVMAERVLVPILDLMAAAYAGLEPLAVDSEGMVLARRRKILNYIEAHIGDVELTVNSIASSCGITPRYVHKIFADREETVGRYILRRRLEACARALVSESQRHHSILRIAFDWGFNSQTHFGRVFRAKFGVAPGEYRRSAPPPDSPPYSPDAGSDRYRRISKEAASRAP